MSKLKVTVLAVLLGLSTVLAACSSRGGGGTPNAGAPGGAAPAPAEQKPAASTSSGPTKKISWYLNANDVPIQEAYKQLAEDFKKENPSIDVELRFPGSEYENLLKVKMAANDMPDVFDTHGWAILRYGQYLADLRDEPWAAQMTDTIKPVVTDDKGKVYVLVVSEAKDGISYNADVLKKYNIEPPKTIDELTAAAQKILKESNGETVPFFFSGADNYMIGRFYNWFANSLYFNPSQNESAAFKNNTFDWNKWNKLSEILLDWQKKGLINKDALTAKYADVPQLFAQGKIAFMVQGPSYLADARKINPNVKVGIMPTPASAPGEQPDFSGGERNTMGAWKDSKNLAEAKKLIAFVAKPENMAKIANVSNNPPGLKGVKTDNEFSQYYEKYTGTRVVPFFDRVNLPNGVYQTICLQGVELLAGRATPAQVSQKIKQEVDRLWSK